MKIDIHDHLPIEVKQLIKPYLSVDDFEDIATDIGVSTSSVTQIYYRRLPISEKLKEVPQALIERALDNAKAKVDQANKDVEKLEKL